MLEFDYLWIWIPKVLLISAVWSWAALTYIPKIINNWKSGNKWKQWSILFSVFVITALFTALCLPHSRNLPSSYEKEVLREIATTSSR